jgi:hypothetical protein
MGRHSQHVCSMPQERRLQEQDRSSRRTIADAVDIVRQTLGGVEIARARVHVYPLLLPSGKPTALVDIVFSDLGCRVSLPTSTRFTGLSDIDSQRKEFEIALLDGAEVSSDGSVRLASGLKVRAVEVVPTPLPYIPSQLDEKILRHVIELTKSDHCYRRLLEGLPGDVQERFEEELREASAVDYSRIRRLHVPALKVIRGYINDKEPALRLSEQKIADALAIFGARTPRRRERKGRARSG